MIIRIDALRERQEICSDLNFEKVDNCFWVDIYDKDSLKKAITQIRFFLRDFDEIPQLEIRSMLFYTFDINIVQIFQDILELKKKSIPNIETRGGFTLLTFKGD